jgi:hypothetical protein
MSEIIIVQGKRLKIETGDELWVEQHYCGRCECDHTEITVRRNNKEISRLGDNITLRGDDEVFGGVVVDKDGNVLPDPHWILHILSNNVKSCMTADQLHYVGLCGTIIDGQNRMAFTNRNGNLDRFMSNEEKARICPDCRSKYGKEI